MSGNNKVDSIMSKERRRCSSAINLAEVIFSSDKIREIVPVNRVEYDRNSAESINPCNREDFEKNHKYIVTLFTCVKEGNKCKKAHDHPCKMTGAYIYHLGGEYILIYI